MLAALKLSNFGTDVLLVDNSLPASQGELGGFAKFSGAKFSLPPAGMGLVGVTESKEILQEKILEVLHALNISKLIWNSTKSNEIFYDQALKHGAELRKYHSIVLSPNNINNTIARLTCKLKNKCHIMHGVCTEMRKNGQFWELDINLNGINKPISAYSSTVFVAAGRYAGEILQKAGAKPTEGKGIDLGIRIETTDLNTFSALRSLGPDAKIIKNGCRTFCLNSPGLIYRYPFKSITIPGGIIADTSCKKANVGILVRDPDKKGWLERIISNVNLIPASLLERGIDLNESSFKSSFKHINTAFGPQIAGRISDFIDTIHDLELISSKGSYSVHLPLLDWHWDTYAVPGSHRTTLPGVFAIGDCAGHARGLLQAATSGWLAAEEYLRG